MTSVIATAQTLLRTPRTFALLASGAVLALTACSSTPLPPWESNAAPLHSSAPIAPQEPQQAQMASPAVATPLGKVARIESLPYSGAIAQWFPDTGHPFQTPGLLQVPAAFTSNAALESALQAFEANHQSPNTHIALLRSGNSQKHQTLFALVISKSKDLTPLGLEESKRPNVMLVAAQDGRDKASTEALLVIAQELTDNGLLRPLLEHVNIVLVPRANPDAFDANTEATANGVLLQLDHLLLSTPEARYLSKLVRDYRPNVLVDVGEFAAMPSGLSSIHALPWHDVGMQYTLTPNSNEFITKAAREWLHMPAAQALQSSNLRVDWLSTVTEKENTPVFAMQTQAPTSLINTAGLKNIAALQIASRGEDIALTHIQRRIDSLVQATAATLQSAAQRAGDLRKVHAFANREVASRACRGKLVTKTTAPVEQRTMELLDIASAQPVETSVKWVSSLDISEASTRGHACGYWLSANAVEAAERLSMMGINVQNIAELSSLQAETYQTVGSESSDAGKGQQLSTVRSTMDAPPGSFYISMNQPLAFLAAAALEPDSTFSLYSAGVLKSDQIARIVLTPNLVFEDD